MMSFEFFCEKQEAFYGFLLFFCIKPMFRKE